MLTDPESLRILILNGDLKDMASFWRCWHLARELAKLGHKITFVTVSRDQRVVPRREAHDGLTLIESPNLLDLVYGFGSGYGLLGIPYRMLRVATQPFDIVHAFEHRPNVLLPAMYARSVNDCPLVADWADWWGITGDGTGNLESKPWPIPQMDTAAEEFIHRAADEVTAISTVLRDRALALGIPPDRVWLIPSGAPNDAIQPMDRDACRRELGISPSTYLLGYVGSIPRDLSMMLPAVRRLRATSPHLKVGIIAIAPPELPESSGEAFVQFGRVPFPRLPVYLGACDAFVLPQGDTVFNRARWPNKFGDYLAAGRPILCSDIGDVAEFVKSDGCGLTWADPDELEQGVESLMRDPAMAGAMGAAARRLAEGRLSWRSLAQDFLRVYYNALARRGSSA